MNAAEFQYAVQTLGWTLVHFLWQGAALGLVYALTMTFTAGLTPRLRYRLGLAVFLLAGAMPVFTFIYLFQPAGAVTSLGTLSVGASSAGAAQPVAWWMGLETWLEPYLPWAVAMWMAGVAVMSTRVCVDWWQVRRLTRVGVSPLPGHWEGKVAGLLAAFRISRPVRVLRSQVVRVPAVIGWLRPVVLLPSAAIIGLSPRQLELIIAHELAHIRRADYLVNLVQVLIETLLFYHPAVRWMSNQLREEREHCCDDAVIGTCGDTLTYAHALTELEEQRQASYQTALAANGGVLSQRIYRMLDRSAPRRSALIWGVSLLVGLAAGSMAVAAQLALNAANPAPAFESAEPAAVPAPPPLVPVEDTSETPARSQPVSRSTRAAEAQADAEPRGADTDPAEPEAAGVDANAPSASSQPAPAGKQSIAAEQPPASTAQPEQEARRPDPVTPEPEPSASKRRMLAKADVPERRPAAPVTEPVEPSADNGNVAQSGEAREPSSQIVQAGDDAASDAGPDTVADPGPTRLASAKPAEGIASRPPEPRIEGGRPLNMLAPEYPRFARLRGIQGSVTAEFTIDRRGRVTDVRVVDSTPAGVFDRSVTDALEAWRFQPLLKDGDPTARRVAKVFEFNLDNGRGERASKADDGDVDCDPLTGTRICRPWSRSDVLGEVRQP